MRVIKAAAACKSTEAARRGRRGAQVANNIMRHLIYAAIFFAMVFAINAENQNGEPRRSLEQLVQEVLRNNAELRAARAKWEAAQWRAPQEGALPNPAFSYRGMNKTDGYQFPDSAEKRFEVEQEFPWFGKRGLRSDIANKTAAAIEQEYAATTRRVIRLAKENYFNLAALQQALAITLAEQAVLRRMEEVAAVKYAAGAVSQQDVLKARAEITMLKQRQIDFETQQTAGRAALNALLNRPAQAPLALALTPPPHDLGFARFEQLAAQAAANRPEIKNADIQVARSRLQQQLMTREYFPDYSLGLEYRKNRDSDDQLMFAVGIGLPIWFAKNRAGVREAQKMIESSQAASEAAEKQTMAEVQEIFTQWAAAHRIVDLYAGELIPQAELRFQASEAGYRTGKAGFLDLLESERFLLNARLMHRMAEGNLGTQWARIEWAIGADLPPAPDSKGSK